MRDQPMQRREFITLLGGAAAASSASWPLVARAQQGNRVRRIGVLMNGIPNEEPYLSWLTTFTQTLQKLGWRERDNVQIDVRWSEGDIERTRAYAEELVGLAPNMILASSTSNLTAVLRATRSIPVVFVQVSDPVAQGFVKSLARPGDNITGFSIYEFSMGGKWVDLLKQMAPSLARVAVMSNPDTAPQSALFLRSIEAAGPSLGVEVAAAPVHNVAEIERAIENLSRQPNSGLVLPTDTFNTLHQDLIIALMRRHRLPTIGASATFVKSGGLMYYGADTEPQFRQAAVYVDRFLKGTKLADLPVQLPTKFTLAINLKAAAALGIDVPLGLLLSVDEVIE
jgi:putative ABC transport system substrate-binding protein